MSQQYRCVATPAISSIISTLKVTSSPTLPVSTASKRTSVTHWLIGSRVGRIESLLHTSLEVSPLRSQQVLLIPAHTLLLLGQGQLMALSSCDIALSVASRTKRRRNSSNRLNTRFVHDLLGTHTLPLAVQNPDAPNLHRAIS